jgi:hypothetical protein
MWTFLEVANVAQEWGIWHALITLSKDGVPESFYLKFDAEPTLERAQQAGVDFARRKNIMEAPAAPEAPSRSISRQDFVSRFLMSEIGAIYAASASNVNLLAFVKKLELYATVNLDNEDTRTGLQLLEQAGILGQGRAAEICV